MIVRGTTPKIEFDLPYEESELEEVELTIAQKRAILFKKYKKDLSFDGKKASIRLSQEETLEIEKNLALQFQVRIKTADGIVRASEIESISPYDLLANEVI